MGHQKRNGKFQWRSKRANHGKLGGRGKEKSDFRRYRRSKGRVS
jgi:hypothetical protein